MRLDGQLRRGTVTSEFRGGGEVVFKGRHGPLRLDVKDDRDGDASADAEQDSVADPRDYRFERHRHPP